MDLGKSSNPVSTVAPVVVRPDSDSNAASVNVALTLSAKVNGMAPNNPRPT